jgi:hypothetical protein
MLVILLPNEPMKDFQTIPYQAKAVDAGDRGVQDYVFRRPDSLFTDPEASERFSITSAWPAACEIASISDCSLWRSRAIF